MWANAFTSRHEGNSSVPVNVTTDVSGPGAPFISNLTCQNETSLYLQWLRPGQVYGKVDLYYIYYRPEDSIEFEEIAVYSVNNRREHNVSGGWDCGHLFVIIFLAYVTDDSFWTLYRPLFK